MQFDWEDLRRVGAETWQTVEEKGGELRDAARLRLDLMKTRQKLSEAYGALGRLHYAAAKKGETPALTAQLEDAVAAVDELEATLSELKAALSAARHCRKCDCGAVNDKDARYCKVCGRELGE